MLSGREVREGEDAPRAEVDPRRSLVADAVSVAVAAVRVEIEHRELDREDLAVPDLGAGRRPAAARRRGGPAGRRDRVDREARRRRLGEGRPAGILTRPFIVPM